MFSVRGGLSAFTAAVAFVLWSTALYANDADPENGTRAILQMKHRLDRAALKQDWQYIPKLADQAREGNPSAQFELSVAYLSGKLVSKNLGDAKKWALAAAQAGNQDAQNLLGDLLDAEAKSDEEAAQAVTWWQKAAEKGNASAMARLGSAYRHGRGVKKDPQRALELFRQSAALGNASGQLGTASMLGTGDGVPKNESEAIRWITVAANAGSQVAQNFLGDVYLKGKLGAQVNQAEGVNWWEQSAAQGNRDAISRLAGIYGIGEEAPEDHKRALFYSLLSQRMGIKGTEAFIQAVEQGLSSAEVTQVRQEVASWSPKPVE